MSTQWRTCSQCGDLHVAVLEEWGAYVIRCKACGHRWPARCKGCGSADRLGEEVVLTAAGPRRRMRCACGVTDASWWILGRGKRRTNAAASFRPTRTDCEGCGVVLGATGGEVHHRVPLYLGGPDTFSNMVLLCRDCHRAQHSPIRGER